MEWKRVVPGSRDHYWLQLGISPVARIDRTLFKDRLWLVTVDVHLPAPVTAYAPDGATARRWAEAWAAREQGRLVDQLAKQIAAGRITGA